VVSGTYTVDAHAVATAMTSDPFWSPTVFTHDQSSKQ
jgi:hypothetical protein